MAAPLDRDKRDELNWWLLHDELLPIPFRSLLRDLEYALITAYEPDSARIDRMQEWAAQRLLEMKEGVVDLRPEV